MSETLVTNYDEVQELKAQLAELRQMLAKLHELNAEMHKDAQRLDWLLKTQSYLSINQLGTRKDIDKEME